MQNCYNGLTTILIGRSYKAVVELDETNGHAFRRINQIRRSAHETTFSCTQFHNGSVEDLTLSPNGSVMPSDAELLHYDRVSNS